MIDVIQARYMVMNYEAKTGKREEKIYGETFIEAMQVQDACIEYAARNGKTWCIFRFHNTVFDVWEEEARQEYEARGFEFRRSNLNGKNDDVIICW